ncbi:MAG: DNA polymerase Y family protein [Rhizobiales bacterium]|nr:DNA polymerase Y family protein [Hyphomicrobiales bacterium]
MVVSSKSQRRILALWFPRLPTDRLQRHGKALKSPAGLLSETAREVPPLAVVAKVDNALRLSAVDRKATSLGLAIGQPLANARAMLPALKVVAADEPADLKLLARIADWCDRFTPYVALDVPRGLLLDVTGAAHLFGGEQMMLNRIRESLHAQGFAVRGAMAGTAMASRAFARHRDGAIIASGEEAKAIAPLPIEALNLDTVTTHAFRRAGLKTVGQAASRKRSELTARFGAATVTTLDQALGHAGKPVSPRRPLPDYWKEQGFAEPIVTEEAIRLTLKSLATALSKVLEQRGEGARRLEAAFFRADGAVRHIAIEMGTPTREPAIVERLFREKLDALADPLDPGFGFDLIRLSASRTERADCETVDLDAGASEKKEIGFLIDRLAARFGSHRILSFQPNGTHIPEAAWTAVPAQYSQPSKLSWEKIRSAGDAPRRPLRLFARPEPVILLTTVPDSPHLCWRRAQHAVMQCEGPERIAMEWWRHPAPQPARDYFRVEDSEGRRYWLYRNGDSEQWFLHGLFA